MFKKIIFLALLETMSLTYAMDEENAYSDSSINHNKELISVNNHRPFNQHPAQNRLFLIDIPPLSTSILSMDNGNFFNRLRTFSLPQIIPQETIFDRTTTLISRSSQEPLYLNTNIQAQPRAVSNLDFIKPQDIICQPDLMNPLIFRSTRGPQACEVSTKDTEEPKIKNQKTAPSSNLSIDATLIDEAFDKIRPSFRMPLFTMGNPMSEPFFIRRPTFDQGFENSTFYPSDSSKFQEKIFDSTQFPIQANYQLSMVLPGKDHLVVGGCTSRGLPYSSCITPDSFYSYPMSFSSKLWDKTGSNNLTCNVQHESGADFYVNAYKPWQISRKFPVLNGPNFKKVSLYHFDCGPIVFTAGMNLWMWENFDINRHINNIMSFYHRDSYIKEHAYQFVKAIADSYKYFVQMLNDGGEFEYSSALKPFFSPGLEGNFDFFIKDLNNTAKLKKTKCTDEHETYPIYGKNGSSTLFKKSSCYDLLSKNSPYETDTVVNIYKHALEHAGLKDISIEFVLALSKIDLDDEKEEWLNSDKCNFLDGPIWPEACFLRLKGKKK